MRTLLYVQVAEEMEKSITQSSFPEGKKLGSERELAARYHVSRNVIRKALRLLSEKGIVEIRQNEGAFVTAASNENIIEILRTMLITNKLYFLQSLEVREALEQAIIEKAILHLNQQKLSHLESIYWEMETLKQKNNIEAFIEKDSKFHEQIAGFIPNPFFQLVLTTFYGMVNKEFFLLTKVTQTALDDTQKEHLQILNSLKTNDKHAARQAVENHMNSIRKDLKKLENLR